MESFHPMKDVDMSFTVLDLNALLRKTENLAAMAKEPRIRQELILPEGLYSILPYAFVRCGLRQIRLPAGVTQIPPYAFYQCARLEHIEIRAEKIRIYGHAFDGCEQLKQVPVSTE